MPMKKHTHVVPRYSRDEWERIKAISTDPETMGKSYEDWLRAAEENAKQQESPSVAVRKVLLEAERFVAYARGAGLDINYDTRVRYAIDHFPNAI